MTLCYRKAFILTGIIYQVSNSFSDFIDTFLDVLATIFLMADKIVCVGDLNVVDFNIDRPYFKRFSDTL